MTVPRRPQACVPPEDPVVPGPSPRGNGAGRRPPTSATVRDMVRWQYCVVATRVFNQEDRLVAALGGAGEKGWELVTVYDKASNWLQGFEKGFLLFKRPVLEDEEPEGPWVRFVRS